MFLACLSIAIESLRTDIQEADMQALAKGLGLYGRDRAQKELYVERLERVLAFHQQRRTSVMTKSTRWPHTKPPHLR